MLVPLVDLETWRSKHPKMATQKNLLSVFHRLVEDNNDGIFCDLLFLGMYRFYKLAKIKNLKTEKSYAFASLY